MTMTQEKPVSFDTNNSTYELLLDSGRYTLVKVAGGRRETKVVDVVRVRVDDTDTRCSPASFAIAVAQDDMVGIEPVFISSSGAGWQVTQIKPKSQWRDHTAIPIQADATTERFRGIAVHGDTPFNVPYVSEILPKLWVGGCKAGLALPPQITKVLSLYPWERYTLRDGVEREEVRMYDAGLPSISQIFELARKVMDWREAGETVLVHCQAGLNRSALIVGTALTLTGMSGQQALDLLREKRSPAVLCNIEFENFVRGLK